MNEALLAGQRGLAEAHVSRLKDVFGDRLYIELQRHGLAQEREAEQGLIAMPMPRTCRWSPRTKPISPSLTTTPR